MKRFVERANQQHLDAVLGDVKKEYAGVFADNQIGSAKADLSARMVEDCAMRKTCYEVFMEFLENSARHITEGNISDELIQSYRGKDEDTPEEEAVQIGVIPVLLKLADFSKSRSH